MSDALHRAIEDSEPVSTLMTGVGIAALIDNIKQHIPVVRCQGEQVPDYE